jgi:phosphoenolpyruvate carboxykinase (GTP)
VPREGDIDLSGMDIRPEAFREATAIRYEDWKAEVAMAGQFFDTIGPRMPKALRLQRDLLECSLEQIPNRGGKA